MMHLNLSLVGNVRQSLHYSVSPLFEMAASLHVLAQGPAFQQHSKWIESTLKRFQEEDLLKEWEYLSPIFAGEIPSFFASHVSYEANGIEEQYNFLVDLPTEVFARALQAVFTPSTVAENESSEEKPASPVALDLRENPKVVKARFTLFLCTFMQTIFESQWERVAPKFVRDIEVKSSMIHSQQDIVKLLSELFPTVKYDAETKSISLPTKEYLPSEDSPTSDDPSIVITAIVLSPSWFVDKPFVEVIDDKLYLTYRIAA